MLNICDTVFAAIFIRIASPFSFKRVDTGLDSMARSYEPLRARPSPVICVYTGDRIDDSDVKRVLGELRALGFNGRLSYKTDSDTLTGNTAPAVRRMLSQPGSLEMERRR